MRDTCSNGALPAENVSQLFISPKIIIFHIYTTFGYVSDHDEELELEEVHQWYV